MVSSFTFDLINLPSLSTQANCSFLGVMEFFTLHDDVLAEIFITIHTSSKVLMSWWCILVVVEFFTLHYNILSKIFITVHTSCEV